MADQHTTELHIFRNTNHIRRTKKGTLKSGTQLKTTARNTTGSNHCIIPLSS